MPTVRNILSVVSDAATGRATLETAFRAARIMNCHVDALHVRLSLEGDTRGARITGPARWQGLGDD